MLLIIKKISYAAIDWCQFIIYRFSNSFIQKEVTYYIIDIDNTIADAWPTLVNKERELTEQNRNLNMPVFIGMHKYIVNLLQQPNHKIIFLSARNFRLKQVTNKWLISNGLIQHQKQAILVSNPSFKIKYLELFCNEVPSQIVYIDDLSFNHENGNIKWYQEIIDKVNQLPLKYIDSSEINKINENWY